MYVERTNYYAKPGRVEDVLRVRRAACEIRVRLGLPRGTVFVSEEGADGAPDVQWECRFPTIDVREADLEIRAASEEFIAIRRQMHELLTRFERHLFRRAGAGAEPAVDDLPLDGVPIVPTIATFPGARSPLTGYLFLPPGDGPFPCMLANHGSALEQGSTDRCKPGVAALLMSWGIASFHPHRWGYGDSPGTPWRDEVTGDFGTEPYDRQLADRLLREADDVVKALDYVRGLQAIAADRVGVWGSSFGGTVSLLAAAKSDRFRCVIDFAGAAMNWERTPVLRRTMTNAARQLTQPILLIQADNDYSTAPTRELAATLDEAGVVYHGRVFPAFGLSPDEGHSFERAGSVIWARDVRRFLERHL